MDLSKIDSKYSPYKIYLKCALNTQDGEIIELSYMQDMIPKIAHPLVESSL
jgi:hypothetical protein